MKRNRQTLEHALRDLERQHLKRSRRTVSAFTDADSAIGVIVDGRKLVNFCSNDYLGLARHPKIAAAMSEAATRYGSGSGASHLVTGHGAEHEALERELAAFAGRERALLFSTGYMANLAAITAFADRADLVLLDKLSHASLIDGGLLAKAHFRRYAHADAQDAARELAKFANAAAPQGRTGQRASDGPLDGDNAARAALPAANGAPPPRHAAEADSTTRAVVLATDGVFSMDGDLAPLPELVALAKKHESWLVVDDAHGLGVMGPTGRGAVEHFGLSPDEVPLLVGTLGKAFGSFGAFIAGDHGVIELLMQRARSYIYTTALPQPVAAATRAALQIIEREAWRRERVLSLTQRFRSAAKDAGIPLADSITPIQPIHIGDSEEALNVSRQLFNAGFWVTAIRPPTVPKGTARLRVTLSAAHTEAQVDALVAALHDTLSVTTAAL